MEHGFAVVPAVLKTREVSALIQTLCEIPALQQRNVCGLRRLSQTVPAFTRLAESPAIRRLIEPFPGPNAFPVRALFFDKTPAVNWKVPWHQDLTIAVQQKLDVPGFGPWSVKDGVPHVQPPVDVLERMLTVRLHLDDCDEDNGPLRVLPRSHRHGRLSGDAIQEWRVKASAISCAVKRGGVVLMRPLLLHASSVSRNPSHRRVVHLEFASEPLPGGLRWLE